MTGDPPLDNEFVTAFGRILARARTWSLTRESRNDADAVNDEAAEIRGELRDLLISAGLAEPFHHGFRVEAADVEADPDWSQEAVEARRLLLGAIRVMMEFGPAIMPGSNSMTLVADWAAMANGDPSLIGSRIPAPNRRSKRPLLGDMLKAQIVRLSYYNAGLTATDWETEMRLIYSTGSAGGGTHRQWKLLIGSDERRECKRVGGLKRAGLPLTQADARIAEQATRYTVAELRAMFKALP
jgi:hypothetical protein